MRVLPPEINQRTVRSVLDHQAEVRPEATALIAPSLVSLATESFSYSRLRYESIKVAGALHNEGISKGDRVAIMLGNDAALEAHLSYHASHWLGAINVPINIRYRARELAYVLGFIKPSVIVVAAEFVPVLNEIIDVIEGTTVLEVADRPSLGRSFAQVVASAPVAPAPTPLVEDDDADWIFTSGTTSNPKAVALTHANSVACGHQAIPVWDLDAAAVYQSSAPFFTSTGCHTNLLSTLVAGCTYAIEPSFDVHDTLARMERYGTTSTFLVNSALALTLDRRGPSAFLSADLPNLRRICWGGQAASPELCRTMFDLSLEMGIELTNVYGFTESGNAGIMLIPEDHADAFERMGSDGMSIGRTSFHPWVEHAVLREDGSPVDVGERGELCLRGPSMMKGYVGDEASSAEVLKHGWVYSGDICRVDEAGFVYFVDRRKQMIRRSGLNISSAEVEGALLEHPAVAEAAVVPRPNPILGEEVRAVVVAAHGYECEPPGESELIEFCRERLADYKLPATVEFVDELPRNGMGRVIKRALTEKRDLQ